MIKLKLGEQVLDVVSMKIRIGNAVVEVERFDETGHPIIPCYAEDIPNAKGGNDVVVHVPCLSMGLVSKL